MATTSSCTEMLKKVAGSHGLPPSGSGQHRLLALDPSVPDLAAAGCEGEDEVQHATTKEGAEPSTGFCLVKEGTWSTTVF